MLERQPGAGLETSFANAGQVSPGYSAPWAAPGIPVKALRWLMMRHRPLVLWAAAGAPPLRVAHAHARELHRGGLPAEQGPHGAAGRVQPRRAARPAHRDRHRLRSPGEGHAAALPDAEAARPCRRRHPRPRRLRRALHGAGSGRLHRGRAGTRRRARRVRRRPAAAGRRDRRRAPVHTAPRRALREPRRDLPLRHGDRAAASRRRPGDGGRDRRRGASAGGRLRGGARAATRRPCCAPSGSPCRSTR